MLKFSAKFIFLLLCLSILGLAAGCGSSPGGAVPSVPTEGPTAAPTIDFPTDPNMTKVFFITKNPVLGNGSLEITKKDPTGKIEGQAAQIIPLGNEGTGSGEFLRNTEFGVTSKDSSGITVTTTSFSTSDSQTTSLVLDGQTGAQTPTPDPDIPTPTLPPTPGPGEPTWTPSPTATVVVLPTATFTPGVGTPTTVPPTATPTNVGPNPTATFTPTATNTPTSTPTEEAAPNPQLSDPNFVAPLNGSGGGVCVDESRNLGYTVNGRNVTQFNSTNGLIIGSTNEDIISHSSTFHDVSVNSATGNFYGIGADGYIFEYDSNRNKLNSYYMGVNNTPSLVVYNGKIYYSDPDNSRVGFRSISNLSNPSQFIGTGQLSNAKDLNIDPNGFLHVCTSNGVKKIDLTSGNIIATYGPNSAGDVSITGNFARIGASSGIEIWNITINQKARDITLANGAGLTTYVYGGKIYTLVRIDAPSPNGKVIRYMD